MSSTDHAVVNRRGFFLRAAAVGGGAAVAAVRRPKRAWATGPAIDVSAAPHNATGNGTTDDAAAIQSAIDAGGGAPFTVYFPLPSSAYLIGSTLQVPDNCALVGERGNLSTIACKSTLTGAAVANKSAAGNKGITLRNLRIDGNKGARASVTAPLVSMTGASSERHILEDCRLEQAPAAALLVENTPSVRVVNNEFVSNAGSAVVVRDASSDIRVESNIVSGSGSDALVFDAAGGVLVRVLVSNNVLQAQSAGSGIVLAGVRIASVDGNIIESPFASGIKLTDVSEIICADNIVNAPGASASVVGTGIEVNASGADVVRLRVDRNRVSSPRAIGILARATGSHALRALTVEGNAVSGSTTLTAAKGIVVDGSEVVDAVVNSNLVTTVLAGGIVIGDGTGSVERPTMVANVLRDCGGTAILVRGASAPLITGNRGSAASGMTHGLRLESVTGTINEYGNGFTNATTADVSYSSVSAQRARVGLGDRAVFSGTGSPEGIVAAPSGALFLRTDGGAGSTLYVKESGSGTTGWIAK